MQKINKRVQEIDNIISRSRTANSIKKILQYGPKYKTFLNLKLTEEKYETLMKADEQSKIVGIDVQRTL